MREPRVVAKAEWLGAKHNPRFVVTSHSEINHRKLTEYALNPNHSVASNKAKALESAFGFNQRTRMNSYNNFGVAQ